MVAESEKDSLAQSEQGLSADLRRLDLLAEGFSFPTSLTFDTPGVAYVSLFTAAAPCYPTSRC